MSNASSPRDSRPAFWPTQKQYGAAIQNLSSSMTDPELREGEAALDRRGLPMVFAGGFANVYQVHCPRTGNRWAVKFFKRGADGLRERYQAISEHLRQAKLPFMVEFQYLPEGVLVDGSLFPLVKMRWVEGQNLNAFVADALDRPELLDQLIGLWMKLSARLRKANIAHADLQHGNVLLVSLVGREGLRLRLIDYDGMFVPALAGQRSGEVGHPCYQHPFRLRESCYDGEVDRFSHLAISCALLALRHGGRKLWEQYNTGENLLFTEQDFAAPDESALLRELWTKAKPVVRSLVGHLILATQQSHDEVPLLEQVVRNGAVVALSAEASGAVDSLLGMPKPVPIPTLPITWPTPPQYNDAMQDLRFTTTDEELRSGEADLNPFGLPIVYVGNYSNVYRVYCPMTDNTWAVKCFTSGNSGLQSRYHAISQYLAQVRLPYFVDFKFLSNEIQIQGEIYPLLKMKWVDGVYLHNFVEQSLDQPQRLDQLLQLWLTLAGRLADARIAHGDLQHGNVMLVHGEQPGRLSLKLIDYDGMFVPVLAGQPSGEVGHACYQHPARLPDGAYDAGVDRFSLLVIACALLALRDGGRKLWTKYDNDENLLFTPRDFAAPRESSVLRELWTNAKPDVRSLVGYLILATRQKLDEVPLLDQVFQNGEVVPLSPDKVGVVNSLFGIRPVGTS